MHGRRLLRTLKLTNLLSYGSGTKEIELEPLNVLIGPNASGKSNLIEAIALLQAAPSDFAAPIRAGGGIGEWLWKGQREDAVATVETTVDYPQGIAPLRYRVSFTRVGQRMELVDEAIENERITAPGADDVFFFYRFQQGHPVLSMLSDPETTTAPPDEAEKGRLKRFLRREDLNPEQSVLSQRKDPDQYPELTYVGNQFAKMRLYREWTLGRHTPARLPQKPDLPEDFLLEDASNLVLVLNSLEHRPAMKGLLVEQLREFYERVEDITTKIQGGTVQVFLHEKGLNSPVPATRLSDGTLRYLCLLTILCHPEPPPLVCIEEPELGLHPDILPSLGELLIEASERTQLIVTTHSDTLVSALSDVPEAVLVCEQEESGSALRRLERGTLAEWLEKYSLGELWRKGEIGGTRW